MPYANTATPNAAASDSEAARHAGARHTPSSSAMTSSGTAATSTDRGSEPAIGVYVWVHCRGGIVRHAFGDASSHPVGMPTYERSSPLTDSQPSNLSVRTRSVRRMSIALVTPAPPPAPRPYA